MRRLTVGPVPEELAVAQPVVGGEDSSFILPVHGPEIEQLVAGGCALGLFKVAPEPQRMTWSSKQDVGNLST